MNNIENHDTRLSESEKKRFRYLTDKIIIQQSQPRILSESEKKDLFALLKKLELYPKIEKQNNKNSKSAKNVIAVFSFLSIYILLLGVPIAIALLFNVSFIFVVYMIISATLLSVIVVGTMMTKVSPAILVIVSAIVFVIGVALFYILKIFV